MPELVVTQLGYSTITNFRDGGEGTVADRSWVQASFA